MAEKKAALAAKPKPEAAAKKVAVEEELDPSKYTENRKKWLLD